MIRAVVTTNCEEDEFLRVKVKCPSLWPEESELLPVLNGVYLEKGDSVVLSMTSMSDVFIMGKFVDYAQVSNNPKGVDPVLFQIQKEDEWIVGTAKDSNVIIESSAGFKIEGFYENLLVTTPDGSTVTIEDDSISILTSTGATVVVKGDKVSVKNASQNLQSILDELLTNLSSTAPTTMGSPAAQTFNPAIITAIQKAQTDLSQLME